MLCVFLLQFELGKLWENLPKMQGSQGFIVLGVVLLVGLFFLAFKVLVPGTERQASADKKQAAIKKEQADIVSFLEGHIAKQDAEHKEQVAKLEAEHKEEVGKLEQELEGEQRARHKADEELRQCEQKRIGWELLQNNPMLLRQMADRIDEDKRELPAISGMARILVVEDHPDARLALQAHLQRLAYSVTVASNAVKALDLCTKARKTERFSLIILDEAMPGLSGREVVKLLRVENDQTPIVFLTGHAEKRNGEWLIDGHTAAELDVKAIWTKPMDFLELKTQVERVIE